MVHGVYFEPLVVINVNNIEDNDKNWLENSLQSVIL